MALTKRVEVLFDPGDYQVIEALARAEGLTVGALVRQAVEQRYLRSSKEKRRAAVQGILTERSGLTWDEARQILETQVGRCLEAS